MKTISEILKQVMLSEAMQVVKHLEHHGEKLYTGNPGDTIAHLKATANLLKGKQVSGHNLSYKVDGGVSLVFGKMGGRPFVKYKGEGSDPLYSEHEIATATENKPYLTEPFKVGLKAANHKDIGDNTGYQADIALESSPTTFKGNLITYMKPNESKKNAVAVHTQFDTNTGERTAANPNLKFLETKETHFPHLSLNNTKFNATDAEISTLHHHIDQAEQILNDKKVNQVAEAIGSHVDPTNKTGHRHLMFKQYSNAVQRGEVTERSHSSLIKWLENKIEKTPGAADKKRLNGHMDFVKQHPIELNSLLQAHNHVDAARDTIVNVLHRSGNLPMTPEGGHGNGEGFVSELPGHGQVKFVPPTFTAANVAQKEKFKKIVSEDMGGGAGGMSVGGGGIAGIGINTSSGDQDDSEVKVSKRAQFNYTQANMGNMSPMYGRQQPQYPSNRRRLAMNILNRMNVGREAY